MGKLRDVLSSVESSLSSLGYNRAKLNFTLENVPRSIAHCSYTFGEAAIQPEYLDNNRADYGLGESSIALMILWKVRGSHNASGSYQEGYLDLLDAYEELETALVKNQPQNFGENNLFGSAAISPLYGEDNQEYLLLSIELILDAIREM